MKLVQQEEMPEFLRLAQEVAAPPCNTPPAHLEAAFGNDIAAAVARLRLFEIAMRLHKVGDIHPVRSAREIREIFTEMEVDCSPQPDWLYGGTYLSMDAALELIATLGEQEGAVGFSVPLDAVKQAFSEHSAHWVLSSAAGDVALLLRKKAAPPLKTAKAIRKLLTELEVPEHEPQPFGPGVGADDRIPD